MIKKDVKFYICRHCGNLVTFVNEGVGKMICCGEPMEELHANTADGAYEKHVPFVTVAGDELKVTVGEIPHPMEDNHYIKCIILETGCGLRIRWLSPKEKPEVTFRLMVNDKPVRVYEYCSLHGLWKKELPF